MKLHFQRLVICGVGLLGGSLGLAARTRGLARRVVGLGRSADRLSRALHLGALDEWHLDAAPALTGADAVVLAIPPTQIREALATLAPLLAPGTFVTDVGSVKAAIVADAERLLPESVHFIGSHPMAGSEKTGAQHARPDFYEGCACLLTPTPRTPDRARSTATALWRALGARVILVDPARHDALLAGISHLPHLAAAALMQTLARGGIDPAELAAIAGGGLRDTTRIAAADPALWSQILAENAAAVGSQLDRMIAVLGEWREALAQGDTTRLAGLYDEGRQLRLTLQPPESGGE